MVCIEVPVVAIFNTGSFAPLVMSAPEPDRSGVEQENGRVLYKHDLNYQKLNEIEHVKWCRRNLGDRGSEWDFWMVGGMLYVEVWSEKAKFTYEMWHN